MSIEEKDIQGPYPSPHCPECLSALVCKRKPLWKRLKYRFLCCFPRLVELHEEMAVWKCDTCLHRFGAASEGASSATLTVYDSYLNDSSTCLLRTGWTPRPDILRMLPKGWCSDCDLFVHKDNDKQCLNCGGSKFDIQSRWTSKEMAA